MINLAVVGCGYWVVNYVRVFNELLHARVMFVCNPSEERLPMVRARRQLLGTSPNLDEVPSNKWIDAVVIATPAATHFPIAQQCLRAGKHVLVEKPITTEVSNGARLIELDGADPSRCERDLGSGRARCGHLQLPARRAAVMGQCGR